MCGISSIVVVLWSASFCFCFTLSFLLSASTQTEKATAHVKKETYSFRSLDSKSPFAGDLWLHSRKPQWGPLIIAQFPGPCLILWQEEPCILSMLLRQKTYLFLSWSHKKELIMVHNTFIFQAANKAKMLRAKRKGSAKEGLRDPRSASTCPEGSSFDRKSSCWDYYPFHLDIQRSRVVWKGDTFYF